MTSVDGLGFIASDHDINVMASVLESYKTLVVYFDHDDNICGFDWDDIVVNPISPLPKVISPQNIEVVNCNPAKKLPVFYIDISNRRVEQDGGTFEIEGIDSDNEYDPFVDSDYDLEVEDGDRFEEHVDDDVGEQLAAKGNKKAQGSKLKTSSTSGSKLLPDSDKELEEDGLKLPDSEAEGEGFNLKPFWFEDLNNPTFPVGLMFTNV
jgi:hypothetical protein